MNLLAPTAFAFAAAIPVVVVFYLLKRKRVVKLISSTVLWQKFLAETQASKPFQRLRHNWLLVLQILMLALVVLALARPYFAGDATSSQLRILILDASASMQSTDELPSRFEKARAEALQWVDSLRDNDQMVVVQAGAVTEVKQSPTSAKAALRRAIQACTVTDAPTRLNEALRLAESLTRNRSDAEIHLFSDGAGFDLGEFEGKDLRLIYHRIGQRANNLGVVSLDVRANPEDPAQRAVFAGVANVSPTAQQTEVELLFEGQLLESRPVNLATNETLPLVFVANQSRDGVFTVRLTAKDDLAVDNQASIVSILPRPARVLLVSRGNRFLEKALRAVGKVELAVAGDCTDAATAFDIVVLDDATPTVWPTVNVLAFHTMPTNWFADWSKVEAPPIVDWKNTHPLLRFVNFDNVQVAESFAAKTPRWAVSLADSPQASLLLTGERERQRIVWVGFDLLQTTWPLRISFPIFVANAVEWLNPATASANQLTVRAGDAFHFGLAQPLTGAQLTLPDGTAKPMVLDPKARELVFSETVKQGIYKLHAGTNDVTFCVNLMDGAESKTAPRESLPFGKFGEVKATTLQRANLELWRWIAAAGLMVLLFEWWFYHKRTA